MSKSLKEALTRVIHSVELRDVRLISANVNTRIRDSTTLSNPQLVMRHGSTIIARSDKGFLVGAMMRAQVVDATHDDPSKEETVAPINMIITFALEYALPDASGVDDSVLSEFARVNGTFNAWPYWREYVQTTAARMGLPPLVLPVFRIERGRQEKDSKMPEAPAPSAHAPAAASKKKK